MRVLAFLIALFAGPLAAQTARDGACHLDTPCTLGERSYNLREPDGWDGVTPLPVLLHFHGWGRQGTLIVNHDRIASATRARGVLLVAPNGIDRRWDWRAGSPDVAFADAVLADVAARYPTAQTFVSGYSIGSLMAWRLACDSGADIDALLAIAGTLRRTDTCAETPAQVRHVHGLTDTVMDFPFGPGDDTTGPVALWRREMGCGAGTPLGPWSQVDFLTLDRTRWDCARGTVILDTHPGGHFIPHGWIARQIDELLGLPNAYP